jgi:hypothetical protein
MKDKAKIQKVVVNRTHALRAKLITDSKMRDMQLQKEVESLGADEVDPPDDTSHSMRKVSAILLACMCNR